MELLYIALLCIIGAGIGTLTGFGTSTIMVPFIALFLPFSQTLLLVGIIHWFGDIWKIILFRRGFNWKLVLFFGLPGILAGHLGARLVFSISENLLLKILGAFIIVYVVFISLKPDFKIPKKNYTAVTGGLISGFFAGFFGVGGAIRSAFLSAFDLKKAVFISTAGAIAIFIDSSRLVTYFFNQVRLPANITWGLLIFVPASLLGAFLAKKIIGRIPQRSFRFVIAAFLFLTALKFMLFPA